MRILPALAVLSFSLPLQALDIELSPSLGLASRPGNGRAGLLGQLGVAFHTGSAWIPELVGTTGAWSGLEHVSAGLEAGVRWQPRPPDRTSPWLSLALAHVHDASTEALSSDPGGTLGGFGEGLRHRTGFSVGAGISSPLSLPWGLRLLARVGATMLWPQVDESRLIVGGAVGLARSF